MWNFSAHIEERIEQRDISKEEILSIVNNAVNVLIIPSNRDKTIDLHFGKVQNKYILVVVNKETRNLITVRRLRKNEKVIFDQEFENEKERN